MVAIVYKTGNLLDASERVLIHGCNAQGRMGTGVAKDIKQEFPYAFKAYRDVYERDGLQLGNVVWAVQGGHPVIGNAVTQEHYGTDGNQYVDYDAIRFCIQDIEKFAHFTQTGFNINNVGRIDKIAFPLIGAGRGGGKWSVISQIIEEHSISFTPVVYLRDGTIPD